MSPTLDDLGLPVWTSDELEERRQASVDKFIKDRLKVGAAAYTEQFSRDKSVLLDLLEATSNLLALGQGAAFIAGRPSRPPRGQPKPPPSVPAETKRLRAARYCCSPPISEDDLDTLTAQRIKGKSYLSEELARAAADLVGAAIDNQRFPWVFEGRKPTDVELHAAILATTSALAYQQYQTNLRNGVALAQQLLVREALSDAGYTYRENVPVISSPVVELEPGEFCGETEAGSSTHHAKADVPVLLGNRRALLIECKASSTAVNSVKRLNRETGSKREKWHQAYGQSATTVAVLSGVYKLVNLGDAQASGIRLIFEHELDPLIAVAKRYPPP